MPSGPSTDPGRLHPLVAEKLIASRIAPGVHDDLEFVVEHTPVGLEHFNTWNHNRHQLVVLPPSFSLSSPPLLFPPVISLSHYLPHSVLKTATVRSRRDTLLFHWGFFFFASSGHPRHCIPEVTMLTSRLIPRTTVRSAFQKSTLPVIVPRWRRSYATESEKDLVIIGGGVAGYVAAIKAGQEGMKVRTR